MQYKDTHTLVYTMYVIQNNENIVITGTIYVIIN